MTNTKDKDTHNHADGKPCQFCNGKVVTKKDSQNKQYKTIEHEVGKPHPTIGSLNDLFRKL